MTETWPARLRRGWNTSLRLIGYLLDSLFHYAPGGLAQIVALLFLAGLLVYGIRLWGVFFSWGNISFDFLDWAEVTGPRYALLRDAASKLQLPLHAANTTALRGVTDRYFSIADTPFTPLYLLLPLMEMGRYIFLDTLLFYGLGFIGLLLIYRRYRLSPFTFLLLFLLFNFNGYLVTHIAVGHANYVSAFLLPYFVLLVLNLVENQRAGWRWVLGLSLLMLAILLEGGFHLYLACLIFLALLALFNWVQTGRASVVRPVALGGLFTLLISLPRLLPPSLALSGITQDYLGGFPSLTDLFSGLAVLQDPQRAIHPLTDTFPLNAWETDFYIGLLGLALLLIFGVVLPLLKTQSEEGRRRARERGYPSLYMQILLPSAVLAALSIGQVYARVVSFIRIPPFTGERVTSRLLIVPLVFVTVLAVIYLQRLLDERSGINKLPTWGQILALGPVYLIFHDLYQHMQAWRIRYLDSMTTLFPKVPFDPAQHTIANHADPVYVGMLVGGLVVALLALGFVIWMAILERRGSGSINSFWNQINQFLRGVRFNRH